MTRAFLQTFISITLLSAWSNSVPLDYKDPKTWFENVETNNIDNDDTNNVKRQILKDTPSTAAFQIVVTQNPLEEKNLSSRDSTPSPAQSTENWSSPSPVTSTRPVLSSSTSSPKLEIRTQKFIQQQTLQDRPVKQPNTLPNLEVRPSYPPNQRTTVEVRPVSLSSPPNSFEVHPSYPANPQTILEVRPSYQSNPQITQSVNPVYQSNLPTTLEVRPGYPMNQLTTLEVRPNYVSSPPSTLEVRPNYASNSPPTLEVRPNYISSPPSTIEVRPNYVSNSPSTLEVRPNYVSSPPSTYEVRPNYVFGPLTTLEVRPNYVSSPPTILEARPNYVSSPPTTLEVRPIYTSNLPTIDARPNYASISPINEVRPNYPPISPLNLEFRPVYHANGSQTLEVRPAYQTYSSPNLDSRYSISSSPAPLDLNRIHYVLLPPTSAVPQGPISTTATKPDSSIYSTTASPLLSGPIPWNSALLSQPVGQNYVTSNPITFGNSVYVLCYPAERITPNIPNTIATNPHVISSTAFPNLGTKLVPKSNSSTIKLRLQAVSFQNNPVASRQQAIIVLKNPPVSRLVTTGAQNIKGQVRRNCDQCKSSCNEDRPICTRPIGSTGDVDDLRGFSSVCHLNCFNSCRRIKYAMVAEGRCGRLRDRMRRNNSQYKLNRNELRRNEYTVVNPGDEAVLIFSSSQ